MRLFTLFICCFLLQFSLVAQVQQSGWLASFNTFKINPTWSLHFDAQARSTDDVKQLQSLLLRPGINYHINKAWVATAGYAYIPARRTIGNKSELLAEHRAWQQLVYNHKINRVASVHRLRFEQRFLPIVNYNLADIWKDGHESAYRLRYFMRHLMPLRNSAVFSEGLFFALQDEVFINTGNKSNVNGRAFDQNRLYLAFGYRLPHSKIDLEAGYMNQYLTGRNKSITNNHIAQLAVYKRL